MNTRINLHVYSILFLTTRTATLLFKKTSSQSNVIINAINLHFFVMVIVNVFGARDIFFLLPMYNINGNILALILGKWFPFIVKKITKVIFRSL